MKFSVKRKKNLASAGMESRNLNIQFLSTGRAWHYYAILFSAQLIFCQAFIWIKTDFSYNAPSFMDLQKRNGN